MVTAIAIRIRRTCSQSRLVRYKENSMPAQRKDIEINFALAVMPLPSL